MSNIDMRGVQNLDKIDFKDIEEAVIKRYKQLVKNSTGFEKVAARVATMAIQEYHRRLHPIEEDQQKDVD